MTHSDLGKAAKALHPGHYDEYPDHIVGRALSRRYPHIYSDHVQPDDMDSNTVPETPETLRIQLGQLKQGMRRAVLVAKGADVKINAAQYGARKLPTPAGDVYYTGTLTPKDILRAVRDNSLNTILGDADEGYGAPAKQDLRGPVSAVVARTEDGETVQDAVTDPEHTDETVDAATKVTPQNGSVSVESPVKEIEHRLHRAGDRWPKPATP